VDCRIALIGCFNDALSIPQSYYAPCDFSLTERSLNDENADNEFNPSDNGATNVDWLVENVEENTENIIQIDVETDKIKTTESSKIKEREKHDIVVRDKKNA